MMDSATSSAAILGRPLPVHGREFDSYTGLQYNRNRYYEARIGRWLSEDPIGFAGGDPNLYVYAGNEPTDAVDPSGHAAIGLMSFRFDLVLSMNRNNIDVSNTLRNSCALITWEPHPWTKSICRACKRVELFQIAKSYQEINWGATLTVTGTRTTIPNFKNIVRMSMAVSPSPRIVDTPGTTSGWTTLQLRQEFETREICTDRNSADYLEIYGTVGWKAHYFARDNQGNPADRNFLTALKPWQTEVRIAAADVVAQRWNSISEGPSGVLLQARSFLIK